MKNKLCIIIIMLVVNFIVCNRIIAYETYNVGDIVTYNKMEFYVIKNSNGDEDYVTVLKKKPLTVSEVNKYGGVGTTNNHVNKYTKTNTNKSANNYAYGGMAFYTSLECGYVNGSWNTSSCSINYNESDIKYVVDNFSNTKFDSSDLVIDATGYKARLLTIDELRNNLGYGESDTLNPNIPSWVYKVGTYDYVWVMDFSSSSWFYSIGNSGTIYHEPVHNFDFSRGRQNASLVRPVVNIKKESLNKIINKPKESDNTNNDTPLQTSYSVGDEVIYKGVKYYVIKNSNDKEDFITLLKDTPLTVDQINEYGKVGTIDNIVNIYATSNSLDQYYQEAYDCGGYGGMAYYASDTCKDYFTRNGCLNDYEESQVRSIVDSWIKDYSFEGHVKNARLITKDEYTNLCNIETQVTPSSTQYVLIPQYDWLYNKDYSYWTMSPKDDISLYWINIVDKTGAFDLNAYNTVASYQNVVRPVIELYKCALDNSCGKSEIIIEENQTESKDITMAQVVNVPDTLKKLSIMFIMIGVISISISLIILIKSKDKIKINH